MAKLLKKRSRKRYHSANLIKYRKTLAHGLLTKLLATAYCSIGFGAAIMMQT